jgi:tetratricopeptide (TPR) repeat protein
MGTNPHLQFLGLTEPGRTVSQPSGAAPVPSPTGVIQVAGYAVGEELGRGGMGVVYRATHIGLGRPVALKVVAGGPRADPRHLARFVAEARAVAAVQHPHVVRVYDAGEHNGLPYLAIELCPNGSLADRLRRDGRLAPRAAAVLVDKLARAVQAAHDAGVVHRDLKPSNVLFDAAGEPQVADFGLAKRGGSDLTHSGAVMGTPAYMAPEQARGDARFVGPAADVWALGVILYECLTETRPFEGDDTAPVLEKVAHWPPEPPRRRVPEVSRELEVVCLKCLEKEPAERYPSARDLADDLGAVLDGRPIRARPVSGFRRAVKWAGRNPGYAGLAAGLALALLAGTAVSTWQAVRADWQANRAMRAEANARREAEDARAAEARARESEQLERRARGEAEERQAAAEEIASFLRDVLGQGSAIQYYGPNAADRPVPRPNRTVRDALDESARKIDVSFRGRPEVEGMVRHAVGSTYLALAAYPEAQHHLDRALALLHGLPAGPHPHAPAVVRDLGRLDLALENLGRAEARAREALAAFTSQYGPRHRYTLDTQIDLAAVYVRQDRFDLADPLLRDTVAAYRDTLGAIHPQTLLAQSYMSHSLFRRQQFAEAEALMQEAWDGGSARLGKDHPVIQTCGHNLAVCYQERGKLDVAEPLAREVLANRRAVFGETHPDTLRTLFLVGTILVKRGKPEEAEPVLRECLAGRRQAFGDRHSETVAAIGALALIYQDRGAHAVAEPLLREVQAATERDRGPDHPETATTLMNLGVCLLSQGKYRESEPHFRKALGIRERHRLGGFSVGNAKSHLGAALLGQDRFVEAEPLVLAGYREVKAVEDEIPPFRRGRIREAADRVVRLYEAWDKADVAAQWRDRLKADLSPTKR